MSVAYPLRAPPNGPEPLGSPLASLNLLPAMAHSIDRTGHIIEVSDLWLSTLGYRRRQALGAPIVAFLTEASREHAERRVWPEFHRNGSCQNIEYQMVRADGGILDVLLSETLYPDSAEQQAHAIAVLTDVTARKATERRLAESEARFRLLAESSADMIMLLDRQLVRRYVSPASYDLFGEAPEDLVDKPLGSIHPNESSQVDRVLQSLLSGETQVQSVLGRRRHRDGRWIWVEANYRALRDEATGAVSGIISVVRDASARKAAEDQFADAYSRLEIIAGQDELTGLHNRRSFNETLATECGNARRRGAGLALILIDVDRFKAYNDRHGHLGGDGCLRRVAKAIELSLYRRSDYAARYGGEEFAVILPDADEAVATAIAERIWQAVGKLDIEHLGSEHLNVTVSVGVAELAPAAADAAPETLIAAADRALYLAKALGRNRVARASEMAS